MSHESYSDAVLLAAATTFSFPVDGDLLMPVEAVRTWAPGARAAPPGHPGRETWSVRWMGRCLNRSGRWEHEPLPSARDEEFYARTRFTRDEAFGLAQRVAAEDPSRRRTE